MNIEDFNYELPEELIAQTPLKVRDSSRLLVLDKNTGEVSPSYLLSDKAQKYLLDELVNIYSKPKKKSKTNTTRVNSGTKWSPEEDQQLLDEYLNQKLKISEIAKIHGRKSGGIRARLKKKHGIEV